MTLLKVCIPEGAHVLLLEDSDMRIKWFQKKCPELHVCKTVEEFIDYFSTRPRVDFIFWDHDLGQTLNGADAAKWLTEHFGSGSRWGVIHSWNRAGANRMQDYLPESAHIPFGNFDIEFV